MLCTGSKQSTNPTLLVILSQHEGLAAGACGEGVVRVVIAS